MSHRSTYHLITGTPRRVYGAKQRAERAAHTLVAETTDGATAAGQPQAMWMKDLRRGRRSVWGSLLRYLDFLHRKGVALETALIIPRLLESYVLDLWSAPAPDAKVVPLYREHEKEAA